jgi:hypothetical protein
VDKIVGQANQQKASTVMVEPDLHIQNGIDVSEQKIQ